MVGGGAIAVRDRYAGYAGMRGGNRTEGEEGFLGKGTAAMAEEDNEGWLARSGRNAELGRRGSSGADRWEGSFGKRRREGPGGELLTERHHVRWLMLW